MHAASSSETPIPSVAIPKGLVGTMLFICSEVFVFGAMFAAYFFIRVVQDPGYGSWERMFGSHLAVGEALVNTAILLASSGTAWLAQRLRETRRGAALAVLAGTIFLGIVFLAIQVKEFTDLAVTEHAGPRTSSYASVFYTLTSIHGLHVLVGILLLSAMWIRLWRGRQTPAATTAYRAVTLYWHFVDAMWVVIICTVYLPGNLARII